MKTKTKILCAAASLLLPATGLMGQINTIANFTSGNGANPQAALIASGGLFYGTTYSGGVSNLGTVYSVNTNGVIQTLYSFAGAVYNATTQTYNPADGQNPVGALVLSSNMLYGTTSFGGNEDSGTVFAVNTNGSNYSVLYSFTGGSDGSYPQAGLILVSNVLFGTTFAGGYYGQGAVFRVNTDGTHFTNIYSFTGSANGSNPEGRLVASGNTLYGTTYGPYSGGTGHGTVFHVNMDGTSFSNVYNFTGNGDGAYPEAGLVLSGSTLYGTTFGGGDFSGMSGDGVVFSVNTNGTGFQATPLSYNIGSNPQADLIMVGTSLFGTTVNGGTQGYGAIFEVNTSGSGLTNLYSFLNGSDGANPEAGLTQAGNILYGTTDADDAYNLGTVFSLPVSGIYPTLSIGLTNNQVTLSWTGSGYTLVGTSNLSGAYTILTNASPYTTVATNKQMFYHLQ